MANIRKELVNAAFNSAFILTDIGIHQTEEQRHGFRKQTILANESLTKDEKSEAIRISAKYMDYYNLLRNEGTKRICENCQEECLATLYCENCIRNFLKIKFSTWTSGNNDVDNLIQNCQMETIAPDMIVEWIPYNNLRNIEYLTSGGFSEIYTAVWIDGKYEEFDYEEIKLKRFGDQNVVLKKLENVENANRSWFEESKSHLITSSKYVQIVPCYGLTKYPLDGSYMLVMNKLHSTLREYLRNNDKLTWKDRLQIAYEIVHALYNIHQQENSVHRDLHSGNILYNQIDHNFRISDFGFCGPVDKPQNSIYGNLHYIAPEIIYGKETTFSSDIYSFGILMWEISSSKPPFDPNKDDYQLAMEIVNGMRPKTVPGTPIEYKNLMEQCWDANPDKRPDISSIGIQLNEIRKLYENVPDEYENIPADELETKSINQRSNFVIDYASSKVHQFENFPEPKNALEGEQEAYHSKPHSFNIPDDINDFIEKNN